MTKKKLHSIYKKGHSRYAHSGHSAADHDKGSKTSIRAIVYAYLRKDLTVLYEEMAADMRQRFPDSAMANPERGPVHLAYYKTKFRELIREGKERTRKS